MATIISIAAVLAVVFAISKILSHYKKELDFISTGVDSGFKLKEIMLLFKVANSAQLEEPSALYWSVPALNRGIAYVLNNAREKGIENTAGTQAFLTKLYNYRTKVELDPRNSRSLKTTRGLSPGQRIRIVLKGRGVFSSSVISAGRELVISLPVGKSEVTPDSKEWIGKQVSVYLNRPGDAGYVFDTFVRNALTFSGKSSLYLAHTDNLLRTQKRKTVRCSCNIFAQLYVCSGGKFSQTAIETEPGLKCLIEDISENGAMVRIGGMGRKNISLKLQFPLGDRVVVMFGIVRAVEYNSTMNQSRLHVEGIDLEPEVKNAILSYVYNVIPKDDRDAQEAISQAEEDSKEGDALVAELTETSSSSDDGVPPPSIDNVKRSSEDKEYTDFSLNEGKEYIENVEPDGFDSEVKDAEGGM